MYTYGEMKFFWSVYISFAMMADLAQAGKQVTMQEYSNNDYFMVNGTTAKLEEIWTMTDCMGICLKVFKSSCRSAAYRKTKKPGRCIISSEMVFRREAGMNVVETGVGYYELYSTGSCEEGYKFNPNTRTCVGLYTEFLTWQDAYDHCESIGELLLTLPSKTDAEWLAQMMIAEPAWNHAVWIGGRRERGSPWQWHGQISGEISYVNDYWFSGDGGHGFLCLIVWTAAGYPDGTLGDEHCDVNIQRHLCETTMLF